MFANNVVTGVNLDEENIASSSVQDDGCGCCMSSFQEHEIESLERAVEDMKELLESAERVLEARKELFVEVGESISLSKIKEEELECQSCGKSYHPWLTISLYNIQGDVLCKNCVEDRDALYRDTSKVYRKKEVPASDE